MLKLPTPCAGQNDGILDIRGWRGVNDAALTEQPHFESVRRGKHDALGRAACPENRLRKKPCIHGRRELQRLCRCRPAQGREPVGDRVGNLPQRL